VRILLFTGKGGVGKTSVAAATAVHAARAGVRTLLASTDPAHSLADAFELPVADEPTRIAAGLDVVQIDARRRLEEHWKEIRDYVVELLAWGGAAELEAEELAVLPGLEEILALIDVRRHVEQDAHDLLVLDCAPTAETLRLLSLPDVLGWYISRVLPVQRRVTTAIRPVWNRVTSLPLPQGPVLGAVERLTENLDGVRRILLDPESSSVRLVVNPERMVIAEARRTATYLSLFGYGIDAVVINRLLPEAVQDPFFARWKAAQDEHLEEITSSFPDVPLLRAPLLPAEPLGEEALAGLGALLYGAQDPVALLARAETLRFTGGGGRWTATLPLPFAAKGEVDMLRRGDELVVRVGPYTRSILLPVSLSGAEVVGAGLTDGRLEVRFAR
jgi:arsenite/tail-anchored protein-transporting ATPase